MSLIICPECKKEISDKAKVCIHCGYPISEYVNIDVNDNSSYNIYIEITKENKCAAIAKVREVTGLDIIASKKLVESNSKIMSDLSKDKAEQIKNIFESKGIKTTIAQNNSQQEKEILIQSNKSNQPKCPTCGSTNISKISTTSKAIGALGFGLLSKTARSQFECKSCGYKW